MGASIKTCGPEILTKLDPDKHCMWGGMVGFDQNCCNEVVLTHKGEGQHTGTII